MKKLLLIVVFLIAAFTPFAPIVSAATIDIPVLPAGDVVHVVNSGLYSYSTETHADANPNQVSHGKWDDEMHYYTTTMTFDLPTLPDLADILSVTLNYDVISVWDDGGLVIGFLDETGAEVRVENGTGWQLSRGASN